MQHDSRCTIGEKKLTAGRTDSIESKITLHSAGLWQNMSRTPRRPSPPATPAPGRPCPRSRRRRTFLSNIGTSSTRSCSATRPSSARAWSSVKQQLRDFWHHQHVIQRNQPPGSSPSHLQAKRFSHKKTPKLAHARCRKIKIQLSATERKVLLVRVACDRKIQEHNMPKRQVGGLPTVPAIPILRPVSCTKTTLQTSKYEKNYVIPGIEPGTFGITARSSSAELHNMIAIYQTTARNIVHPWWLMESAWGASSTQNPHVQAKAPIPT